MRKYQSFGLAIIFVFSLTIISSAQNYKIKQTVSMNGQKSKTTIYVKGLRKRTEGGGFMRMSGDVATVEQCVKRCPK
jgi:hypothetical protein